MSELVKPIAVIMDRERWLRYSVRGLRALAVESGGRLDFLGNNILPALQTIGEARLEDLMLLFWAGLVSDDPALTFEKFQDIVTPADLESFAVPIKEAYMAAFPHVKLGEEQAADENPPSLSTGLPSGPSGESTSG